MGKFFLSSVPQPNSTQLHFVHLYYNCIGTICISHRLWKLKVKQMLSDIFAADCLCKVTKIVYQQPWKSIVHAVEEGNLVKDEFQKVFRGKQDVYVQLLKTRVADVHRQPFQFVKWLQESHKIACNFLNFILILAFQKFKFLFV